MNARGPIARSELPRDDEILEKTGGENPLRFLNVSEEMLPVAVIQGINDTDRLEGWKDAEKKYFESPRPQIMEAIARRKAELTGVTADPTPEPVSEEPESVEPETTDPTPEPEPSVHPRSRLNYDEVLVVDRGNRTEYITPSDADSEEPYHSRLYDAEGELKNQCDLSESDVERRLGPNCERTGADTIEIDLETTGATGVRA